MSTQILSTIGPWFSSIPILLRFGIFIVSKISLIISSRSFLDLTFSYAETSLFLSCFNVFSPFPSILLLRPASEILV